MNKLHLSSSPYLQQHANNPVFWLEWGPEALKLANDKNKPLIISIGYAACHWCHVMEHESFSDTEVADFMNENFVCIKVDREERPDIDQVYMEAAQLINGQGGWPLNAFALPDGRPFFAGTYFNKQRWMDVLMQIADIYKNENAKVVSYAKELTAGINNNQLNISKKENIEGLTKDEYLNLKDNWAKSFDIEHGGTKRAPKFPLPAIWEFMLQYHYFTNDKEALDMVCKTLDEMGRGGIYDQIGGGFARYSVDSYWKVPHFEKMLYDNGQLVSLYSHAYQLTNSPRYKEIIDQTLDFIALEMTDENGGFYSSLNADSENVEGKFYVFTYDEINNVIEENNRNLILNYYQIADNGNWEDGKNILLPVSSKEDFAKKNNIELHKFKTILDNANSKILALRGKRIRPSTDNKILTSWNSLMISGYVDAYKALRNPKYLEAAIACAGFIKNNMQKKNGGLYRNYMNGKPSIDAFLDDYALFSQSCIDLYSVTFDISWLSLSKSLTDYCIEHFYNPETKMFYYTSNMAESLVARKYEISDNVIPSSNSIMANVLLKLGHYYNNESYIEIATSMVDLNIENVKKSGIWYSNWASVLGLITHNISEVAILGENAITFANELQEQYLPSSLFLGGISENLPLLKGKVNDGETTIYVCRNRSCDLPVNDPDKALKQIILHKNPTR